MALHLKKLESPSPMNALCQVWLKLSHWSLRRRFLKFVNVHSLFRNYPPWKKAWPFMVLEKKICINFINILSLFRNYLPLKKGMALHLNKLESTSPWVLCAKFGWNWPSGSWEEDEIVIQKRLQTDGQMDNRRSEKLTWAISSGELKSDCSAERYFFNKC